ncbi:Outer membrane protein beta-barrel domain protein (plasmid) [Gemmatirosa kalamazoonensis]|uniref:Outer membrane protein beta-barrel domain protein n=1 Tax=Gemmatirosa kalamazoonensis TaxID=861299 RepID=W0RQC2_9BACT|nr:porin family protein [Gemmatirosa kalamazoonensis]AHG92921.1 Outer membrane protein beta-barrel domain protein [Gemmatirosa kalamazoonensis]
MQRRISFLSVALALHAATTAAHAQRAAAPTRFGVLGGASAATFHDAEAEMRHRVAALLGAYAVIAVSRHVAIRPELLYSMKGAQAREIVNSPAGPIPSTFTTNVDYVEVPVLARVEVASTGRVAPYLIGGPAVALRGVCDTEERGVVEIGRSTDCGDTVRRFDAGMVLGAGVAIGRIGAGALDVGARYDVGLVRIVPGTSERNRALSLTAGFEAPLPW